MSVRWMKVDEACTYAGGISRKTLYAAIRGGRLQAGRLGSGRNVVISDAAIDRWLEASQAAAGAQERGHARVGA